MAKTTETEAAQTATEEPQEGTAQETIEEQLDFEEPESFNPEDLDAVIAESDSDDDDAADEIDEDLLRRAEAADFSREEAMAFGDADTLRKALDVVERKVGERREAPDDTGSDEEYKVGLDKDYHDDDIVNEFEKLSSFYKSRVAKLEAQLQEVSKHYESERKQTEAARFDHQVESLGAEFTDELGAGPTSRLKPGSSQAKTRAAILDRMEVLRKGYESSGRKPPGYEDLFQDAVAGVLRGKVHSIARRSISKTMSKRQGQFLARPTRRDSNTLSPEKQAEKNLAMKLRDLGVEDESGIDMLPE